ncbi:FKBP4 [Symbiodinium microadriaticum]|nr:FKBP4 [Symbiodinium microadriaticum]
MFHLPETDKIRFCERHRILGNLLYEEGLLPKAAEQYQTALSYYEYCFPEDDETQRSLDTVRYAALCNISLCYCRMGLLREAEAAATQAVRESEDRRSTLPEVARAKAYYRRAQVHRKLDDYESAMADLRRVLALCPDDPAAKQELSLAQV